MSMGLEPSGTSIPDQPIVELDSGDAVPLRPNRLTISVTHTAMLFVVARDTVVGSIELYVVISREILSITVGVSKESQSAS